MIQQLEPLKGVPIDHFDKKGNLVYSFNNSDHEYFDPFYDCESCEQAVFDVWYEYDEEIRKKKEGKKKSKANGKTARSWEFFSWLAHKTF